MKPLNFSFIYQSDCREKRLRFLNMNINKIPLIQGFLGINALSQCHHINVTKTHTNRARYQAYFDSDSGTSVV